MIRGVIFDMDGTLVDSKLDFDAMRRDMGIRDGEYILEALENVPAGPRREELHEILNQYETAGARAATLMPGIENFLQQLNAREVYVGILTRNSRAATDLTLSKFDIDFQPVVTRNEAPAKPDPAGLLRICAEWNVAVEEALFFGDYTLDLHAGRNAGMRTVLYAPDELPEFSDEADFVIRHYDQALSVVEQADSY